MDILQEVWGFTPDGEPIILYTMTNASGASVKLTNMGASVVSIIVPDKQGKLADVALGYGKWQDYMNDAPAMGKSIGRYANRIARGRFTLEGTEYRLSTNNAPNHLHGGHAGFQNRIWESRVETDRVVFSYMSAADEEGYPGELNVEACYDWDDDCNLEITYFAKTNKTTIVNLTNHTYFNLDGENSGTVLNHTLQLEASKYLPADRTQIPTGELTDVAGTPMDFSETHTLGERITDTALADTNGYDNCWAIDGYEKGKLAVAGELHSVTSGRTMIICTTQPGIQMYTGNWLSDSPVSKSGREYADHDGVALECQAFPDSPNKPSFPSVTLTPDDQYEEHTIYSFGTK